MFEKTFKHVPCEETILLKQTQKKLQINEKWQMQNKLR